MKREWNVLWLITCWSLLGIHYNKPWNTALWLQSSEIQLVSYSTPQKSQNNTRIFIYIFPINLLSTIYVFI